MSKDEIKFEINKVLDSLSDKALSDLLSFLKNVNSKQTISLFDTNALDQILKEDKALLQKLAQ
jgi:hypothetical protein